MAVINTNAKALFSQASLKLTDRSMSVAMQQLSSGKRINSARDDAAGMSIVTRMTHQIRSLNQAVRNAGDAVNLIQTAEGATGEINDMMTRMRELAIQAVNDTNSNDDRSYLDLEFQQLKQQIVQIADNTEWNGFSVLNGKGGQQVGEMPVYKVTSDNHFGGVFIQPTTSKTFSGSDAGEVQQFELGGAIVGGDKVTIAGIPIDMTDSEKTVAQAAGRIVNTLNTSANFVANGVTASHSVPDVMVTQQGDATHAETVKVTFADMKAGQTVTVDGRKFTANKELTGAQVAGFFKAGTATSAEGTFSGAAGSFTTPGSVTGSTLVFTGPANTAIADISVSGSVTLNYSGADGNVSSVDLVFNSGGLTFNGAQQNTTATTLRQAVTKAGESISNSGKFLQSGSIELSIPKGAAAGDLVTAVFTNMDNQTVKLTGKIDKLQPATVIFPKDSGVNSTVVSGDLSYTLEDASGYLDLQTRPRALTMTVGVEGSIPRMREGDLTINGVSVGPSQASDDLLSPRNNAGGSAIAIAAAINRVAVNQGVSQGEIQTVTFTGQPQLGTVSVGGVSVVLTAGDSTPALAAAKIAAAMKASPQFDGSNGRTVSYASGSTTITINYPPSEGNVNKIDVQTGGTGMSSIVNTTQEAAGQRQGTGVFAKVNENVFSGQAMVSGPIATGTVFINGYASANIATVYNNSQATRENTVRAINLISDKTGVKAIDTGSDAKGIQLVAADGRNIEVRFETTGSTNAVAFGQRIGMREGVQSSTISLESKIQTPVILGSVPGGDIRRAGMVSGDYSKNQAVQNTMTRETVQASKPQITSVNISADVATGKSVTLVVNGKSYSVRVDTTAAADDLTTTPPTLKSGTRANITQELIRQMEADLSTLGVKATAGTALGEITLTSRTPGTSFTTNASSTDTSIQTQVVKIQESQVAQVKALGANDLTINGVPIRASRDVDDPFSNTVVSSSDPAASAIAIAAAINASTELTGVKAYANPAETVGSVTNTTDPVSGMRSLYVNGIKVDVKFVEKEDPSERRAKVVAAINERTGQHGVVASDNGKGVTLQTKDGRNLSVWFDSNTQYLDASDFGLSKGGEAAQKTLIKVNAAAAIGDKLSVTINGHVVSTNFAAAKTKLEVATALVAQIESSKILEGTNLRAVVAGDDSVRIESIVPGSEFDVRLADGSTLNANVSVEFPNSSGNTDVSAVNLSDEKYREVVLGNKNATTSDMNIRTLYGTVRMVSAAAVLPTLPGSDGITPSSLNSDGRPIQIRVGGDGFTDGGNFRALGFQEGSFGGRASTDMDPPRVGRMAFQVGAGANQYITIDLADFGKKGPITGDITGDVDLAVESRSVRINTREGAQAVLALLDGAMDKVNATRATMGAVMNRLDHVITNLNNVSMNLSASRSQIEDADYAKASTDLARAQILQQAATAVLAQANTSQQSVLKLLGGGG